MISPTVDIVTVSFNAKKTIERTLLSVASQKNAVNRFIVVDGGSNDGTLQMLNRRRDIIDVLISEPDRGISDAFNKGIGHCTGDFVLLLNADDWLVPDSIIRIRELMNMCDEVVCTTMNSFLSDVFVGEYKSRPGFIKSRNSILHPGMFVRRAVYERIGCYDLTFRIGMDYEFSCRHHCQGGKFRVVDMSVVNFSEGGRSGKAAFVIFLESFRVRRRYFKVMIPWHEAIQLAVRTAGAILRWLGLRAIVKTLLSRPVTSDESSRCP